MQGGIHNFWSDAIAISYSYSCVFCHNGNLLP
jgi:hypothetical protein